jgi:hypothetical protein
MKFAYSFFIEAELTSPSDPGQVLTSADPGRVFPRPDSEQVVQGPESGQIVQSPESGQVLNERELWLFDLDGCLVDSFDGTNLRPLARELLEALLRQGHGVDIWSAGGAEYAERVATRVAIDHLIGSFWTKERGPSGKWSLPQELAGLRVVCVDDQPDGVPQGVEKIAVFPYLGPNPHDQVFRKLLDRALFSAPSS